MLAAFLSFPAGRPGQVNRRPSADPVFRDIFHIFAAFVANKLSWYSEICNKILMALKKIILIPVLIAMVAAVPGCSKDKSCSPNPPSSEAPQITAYAVANGINATAHASGLYYEIISQGSGESPSANSNVYITYTGKLLNGTVFDQQNTVNVKGWPLSGLIEGWRIGLPLIQKGGRIKLIIPSALGYGCEAHETLPGNSVLFFDITLVDIQ
jgi:FKBP-type peptidyl-prolyl cis-trans isomerase FkpA